MRLGRNEREQDRRVWDLPILDARSRSSMYPPGSALLCLPSGHGQMIPIMPIPSNLRSRTDTIHGSRLRLVMLV